MRRAILVGRNVRRRHRTNGFEARMSSLVEASSPARLPIQLTLLTTTKPPLNCEPFIIPPPLLSCPSLCVTQQTTPPVLYPLKVSPAIEDWHVTAPCHRITVVQFQNSARQESSERPDSEKPKWEEEQYPDIGKSNFLS